MYLMKQLTSASLPRLAGNLAQQASHNQFFSINKIDALRHSDKDLNRTINKLMDSFWLIETSFRPQVFLNAPIFFGAFFCRTGFSLSSFDFWTPERIQNQTG